MNRNRVALMQSDDEDEVAYTISQVLEPIKEAQEELGEWENEILKAEVAPARPELAIEAPMRMPASVTTRPRWSEKSRSQRAPARTARAKKAERLRSGAVAIGYLDAFFWRESTR